MSINNQNLLLISVDGLKPMKDICVLLLKLVLKKLFIMLDVMCMINQKLLLKNVNGSKTIHKDHAQKDVNRNNYLKMDVTK
jgi:hypothetical protein